MENVIIFDQTNYLNKSQHSVHKEIQLNLEKTTKQILFLNKLLRLVLIRTMLKYKLPIWKTWMEKNKNFENFKNECNLKKELRNNFNDADEGSQFQFQFDNTTDFRYR